MAKKYYKLGTTLATTKVGSPTVSNGVMSGFSASNYATIPVPTQTINKLEWVMCATIPSTVPPSGVDYQAITGQLNTNYKAPQFQTWYNGTQYSVHVNMTLNGTSWSTLTFTASVSHNTKYWLKWQYDKTSGHKCYYSTDGKNYKAGTTITDTTPPVWTDTCTIGMDQKVDASKWTSSIDLTQCYLKINDKIYWTGTNLITSTSSDYVLYEDYTRFDAVDDGTKKRKYYKWASWTQPKLTSASGSGFTTYESSHYGSWAFWNVFKATPSQWHSLTVPQWCAWGYINPLKITKLAFIGNGNGNIADFQVQASDDNATWTTLKTVNNTVVTGNFTVDLTSNTKGYKYYRLYITRGYYTAGGHDNIALISGITITATQLVAGTASDYSYYEETDVFKVVKGAKRKYYKYASWTQPAFTGYTTWGTIRADSYPTSSNQYPWHAVDGKTSGGNEADFCADASATTVNWYWDFKSTLLIQSIKIYNRASAETYGGATTYTIYGLNESGSYETIGTISLTATAWVSGTYTPTTAKRYRGIKVYCSGSKSYVGIGEIQLTAKQITDGTSSSYDYYEDVPAYYLVKE